MLLDVGTEEIGHIEMLATMIAHLLDKAPVSMQEEGFKDAVVGAVMGGNSPRDTIIGSMNPQHAIVSGLGALPSDSVGYPWNGRYIVASGNLLADFRSNLHAESQGRLQAVRMYEMSDDAGRERHPEFYDRPRHDAPKFVAGGDRRFRKFGNGNNPRSEFLPAGVGKVRICLSVLESF
jgi:Mn-containing catalase